MQVFYENKSEKFYCRDSRETSLQCAPHLHYHIEIAIIYDGKCEATVGNTGAMSANGGDIILVFPNQVHSFKTINPERHILLVTDPTLFPEFSHIFSDYLPASNVIRGAANDSELRALTKSISKAFSDSKLPYRDTVLRGYFLAFLGRLFALAKFTKTDSEDMHAIGFVVNYCMANYQKNLSLDLLEHELHINKFYISHIINQKLHMGFNDYINSIRTTTACRYLDEGKLPIVEISELVGFNSVRTFNRAFAKHIGMTPREYKNRTADIDKGEL